MGVKIEIPDELVAALADAVAARLRDVLRPAEASFVTRAEAKAMGVETRALVRAAREGRIETFRLGRSATYRRVAVLRLLESAKVQPQPANDCAEPEEAFEAAVARAKQRRAQR
jgi:hypothetical protein